MPSFETVTPQLRGDLRLNQEDKTRYTLTHPETGATLYLDNVGYLIAEHYESKSPTVSDVMASMRSQYGLFVSLSQMEDFLKKAEALGFFEPSLESQGISTGSVTSQEEYFEPGSRLEAQSEVEHLIKQATGIKRYFVTLSPQAITFFIAVAVSLVFPWKHKAQGSLTIRALTEVEIRSEASGRVMDVLVQEGDTVKKGQLLVALSGYQSSIAKKRAELGKIQAELDTLTRGATPEEKAEVKEHVALATQIAKQTQVKLEQAKQLFAQGLIAEQEVLDAQAEHAIKTSELDAARAKLRLVERGPRPELIRGKMAEKSAVELDISLLMSLHQKSQITSPIDGVVATPDTLLLKGKSIGEGDLVLTITDPSRVLAVTQISEKDVSQLVQGARYHFKVQALPHQTFHSELSRVSPMGYTDPLGQQVVFNAYAEVQNPDLALKPGMSGLGLIDVGWSTIGWQFIRIFVRAFRVNFVV